MIDIGCMDCKATGLDQARRVLLLAFPYYCYCMDLLYRMELDGNEVLSPQLRRQYEVHQSIPSSGNNNVRLECLLYHRPLSAL